MSRSISVCILKFFPLGVKDPSFGTFLEAYLVVNESMMFLLFLGKIVEVPFKL